MKFITWKSKQRDKIKQQNRLVRKKNITVLTTVILMLAIWVLPVNASEAAAVTAKFSILKNILATIVSSIGTLVTLWGLFEFGNSMQTQEGGAQSQAMKRIGGGLVMVLAPQLLVLFV